MVIVSEASERAGDSRKFWGSISSPAVPSLPPSAGATFSPFLFFFYEVVGSFAVGCTGKGDIPIRNW